jgi:multidrug efflux pump subunit AcrB
MIHYSIKNPLMVNLMLAFIILAGVLSWNSMPQEMFPNIELDKVRIDTIFEGAPPEEVERQVTLPIEEAFDGMADIDVIQSTSNEGKSSILITLKSGTNVDDFMRDARSKLDQIIDMPEEAEKPELVRLETRFPVISVALYGDISRAYLYDLAEDVKRRLQAIPGAASIGVAGQREWELWVIVDPRVLAAREVSLNQVIVALRENLKDLPGGSVKAVEGDILLRGKGSVPEPAAVSKIALRTNPQGGRLLLGEVARVDRRLEEAQTLGRFNGRPSVNLTVNKSSEASTIEVARLVKEFAVKLRKELPPTVKVDVFSDLSVYVKTRLETVKSSGFVGLVLVLLSLYLFLNFRVALITAMGIPVSFLFAVIMLNYLGYTINMVSLFAFLIALGMIVDDAIIVNENVYRHMEMGMPSHKAALVGGREVFWPVMASTSTTIAAFLPMFAISGTMGAFIAVIPVVVSAALMGSLIEAFGVLPSHAAEMLRVRKEKKNSRIDWARLLERYSGFLRKALHARYLVAAITMGVLLITIAFAATRVPFKLFGHVDTGQFFINLEAPNTYSLEDSSRLASVIEKAVFKELDEHELNTVLTNVGFTFIDFNRAQFGTHYIQLMIDLKKRKPEGLIERFISPLVSLRFSWEGERERPTDIIINNLRKRIQAVPGVQRLSILRPQGGPAGADIEIGVNGKDVRVLRKQADRVRDYLRSLPGVYDVRHDMEPGKLEYQYSLNERGRELGLTQNDISNVVRTGFLGQEVVFVTSGEDRLPVRLIYTDPVRHSSDLAKLPITLKDGRTIFLGEVMDIKIGRGLNVINRRDLRRLATITAEVDDSVITPLEVNDLVEKKFASLSDELPGYGLFFLGEKKAAGDSFKDMKRATIIALAIIFLILSALFKSLLDPLVVMFAIPFGLIGVVFGHVLFGHHLQFLSLVGLLALSGIVVNDSLILVDFAKRMRKEGMDRIDAMVEAGRVRIRPILLTSITTFLGISPLIFFATGQTAFLSPMAISLGFGLLFATVLILVALPCFYLIADDLRSWVCGHTRRLLGKPPGKEEHHYCRLSDHEEVNDE